jgi:hypothetical protein
MSDGPTLAQTIYALHMASRRQAEMDAKSQQEKFDEGHPMHDFQVHDMDTYVMFCTQCGLSYRLVEGTWEVITFRRGDQPAGCTPLRSEPDEPGEEQEQ